MLIVLEGKSEDGRETKWYYEASQLNVTETSLWMRTMDGADITVPISSIKNWGLVQRNLAGIARKFDSNSVGI